MFSCNLRCLLIFLHGRSRTHRVASLRAGPVGRISYNMYFDCKLVRYVTCDSINEYTLDTNPGDTASDLAASTQRTFHGTRNYVLAFASCKLQVIPRDLLK